MYATARNGGVTERNGGVTERDGSATGTVTFEGGRGETQTEMKTETSQVHPPRDGARASSSPEVLARQLGPLTIPAPAHDHPDKAERQAAANEYRNEYRRLYQQPEADWGHGPGLYFQQLGRRTREGLLASLRALAVDVQFGRTLSLGATLSESCVQKGLNLARRTTKPHLIHSAGRLNADMRRVPEG